jgi:ADP-ribose pyrophosphatase
MWSAGPRIKPAIRRRIGSPATLDLLEGTSMSDAPPPSWPALSREVLNDYEIFHTVRLRTRSPKDGTERTFHFCESPHGVTVVALTPDERMVLVEQFRHPLRRVTLETPAGVIDEGEDPVAAGVRELREETGFEVESAEHLGCVAINPSWQTTRLHVVAARCARPTGEKDEDVTEDTRVRLVPLADVRRMVVEGEIDSATAVAALALHAWARPNGDQTGGG